MTFHNPRIFSLRLAGWTSLATLASAFIGICLESGNGNVFAGFSQAASESLFLILPGLLILAAIIGLLGWLAGRLIGTTLTSILVFGLLAVTLVVTVVKTRPAQRFRNLIWSEAPNSLEVIQHDMLRSFGDGTDYTFVISCDQQLMQDLNQALHLSKCRKWDMIALLAYFEEVPFPSGTEFYRRGHIEAAYSPSLQQAFILRLSESKELRE